MNTFDYTVIYQDRNTLKTEIGKKGEILILVPNNTPKSEIESFVTRRSDEIIKYRDSQLKAHEKMLQDFKEASEFYIDYRRTHKPNTDPNVPYTEEDKKRLLDLAQKVLPQKTAYYADIIGERASCFAYDFYLSRFGSCTGKYDIGYNLVLMELDPELVDYVVVHEVCHLKEDYHDKKFWSLVEGFLPDYKERIKKLNAEGLVFMKKIRAYKNKK